MRVGEPGTKELLTLEELEASSGVRTTASCGRRTPYRCRSAAPVASSTGPLRPRSMRRAARRLAWGASVGVARTDER